MVSRWDLFSASPDTRKLLDPDKFAEITKWAATGFTLLAAVLTFFGIKEGFLDRILRTDPTAAVWVFVLVGLGVLCALFAGAFASTVWLSTFWLLCVVGFLAAVSLVLFPNVRDTDVPGVAGGLTLLLALALVVGALIALRKRFLLPLAAGVLVLGVAATSFGLYGATKIAVASKTAPESPRVTAVLEHQDEHSSVKVSVSGGQREGAPLVIVVRGIPRTDDEDSENTEGVVGRAVMVSDAVGQVEDTAIFPVDTEEWSTLRIGYCEPKRQPAPGRTFWGMFGLREDPPEPDVSDLCVSPTDRTFTERALLGLSSTSNLQVAAALSAPAAGQLQAVASAAAIPEGTTVHTQVVRHRGDLNEAFSTAVLLPDADGNATTTSAAVPVLPGDIVNVCYRACQGSAECDGEWVQIASTTVLGP